MRKVLAAMLIGSLFCSPSCLAEDAKTRTMLGCAGTMTVTGQLPQPAPFTDSLVIDFANMSVSGFTVGKIETLTDQTVDWSRPYPASPLECETGTINRITGHLNAFIWVTRCGHGFRDVLSQLNGRGSLQVKRSWEAVCKPSSKLF